jgi:hypothetical protein
MARLAAQDAALLNMVWSGLRGKWPATVAVRNCNHDRRHKVAFQDKGTGQLFKGDSQTAPPQESRQQKPSETVAQMLHRSKNATNSFGLHRNTALRK